MMGMLFVLIFLSIMCKTAEGVFVGAPMNVPPSYSRQSESFVIVDNFLLYKALDSSSFGEPR